MQLSDGIYRKKGVTYVVDFSATDGPVIRVQEERETVTYKCDSNETAKKVWRHLNK